MKQQVHVALQYNKNAVSTSFIVAIADPVAVAAAVEAALSRKQNDNKGKTFKKEKIYTYT